MDRLFTTYHSRTRTSCSVANNKTLKNWTILKMTIQLLPIWIFAQCGSASNAVNSQTDKISKSQPHSLNISPLRFSKSERHYPEIIQQQSTSEFKVENNNKPIEEMASRQKQQRDSNQMRRHRRSTGNTEIISSRKRRSNRGHSRRHHKGMQRRSCKTVSKYVRKKEVEDMFGNKVKLYPSMHIGSFTVDQYLYETYCDKEQCQCTGINTDKYASSCETDYTLTLAKVVIAGEVGWSHVKVRSGCSCIISEKPQRRHSSILDIL